MDMNVRAMKRFQRWCMSFRQGTALQILCLCPFLAGQLSNPMLAASDQGSVTSAPPLMVQGKVADSKSPATLQKERPSLQVSVQESRPAQPKTQVAKTEESKAKKRQRRRGDRERERNSR